MHWPSPEGRGDVHGARGGEGIAGEEPGNQFEKIEILKISKFSDTIFPVWRLTVYLLA